MIYVKRRCLARDKSVGHAFQEGIHSGCSWFVPRLGVGDYAFGMMQRETGTHRPA